MEDIDNYNKMIDLLMAEKQVEVTDDGEIQIKKRKKPKKTETQIFDIKPEKKIKS